MTALARAQPISLLDRLGADSVERWFSFVGLVLAGYAIAGKGAAYIGVAPLYIGEVALLTGMWLALHRPRTYRIVDSAPAIILIVLMAWTMARMLPYLGRYGVSAPRDSVIIMYGLWAFVVGGLLLDRPEMLRWVVRRYRQFALLFIMLLPIIAIFFALFEHTIPYWPGTYAPMFNFKGGDAMVQLAGATSFLICGLAAGVRWWHVLFIPLGAMLAGAINRGGLVAYALNCAVAVVLRPNVRWGWTLGAIVVAAGTIGYATNFELPSKRSDSRPANVRQIVDNLVSVGANDGEMEGTKKWRLDWWTSIVNYTVYGEYFWTGKGFGINLAVDDDFAPPGLSRLRQPHNGHMTVLARAGVPGAVLWVLVAGAWLLLMADRLYRSARLGDTQWAGWFAFLICFFVASSVNGAFDVYLESPVGGIWHWCIVGLGLASAKLYLERPDLLRGEAIDA